MAEQAERVSPHDLEAERAVLGALLVDERLLPQVSDVLKPADFFRHAHGLIYTAILAVAAKGQAVDFVSLRAELERRGQLEAVNGPAALAALTDGVPRMMHVETYAAVVRERAILRRVMAVGQHLTSLALAQGRAAAEILDEAEQALLAVALGVNMGEAKTAQEVVEEIWPALERLVEEQKGVTGVSTGFLELDDITRGLQPTNLVVLAARPSMGKSAISLQLAFQAARTGTGAVLFSLEMSRQELLVRLLTSTARVDGHALLGGCLARAEYARLSDALVRIGDSRLWIDDAATQTALDIRGKARRLKARHGVGLIVIDYLQLLATHRRAENRNLEIAQQTIALKQLAKELDLPVVVLSQLSREVERRSDHEPQLYDLRDSGAVEADADVVLMLWRPHYYDRDEDPHLAYLKVAKQRNGPVGTIKLRWDRGATRFDNWQETAS